MHPLGAQRHPSVLQMGDIPMLRSSSSSGDNTTVWLATYDASSRGLKLKTLGAPGSSLYLTMQDNRSLTLQTLKYGDTGLYQTWVLADNNGAKALISAQNYLAVGKGASEVLPHGPVPDPHVLIRPFVPLRYPPSALCFRGVPCHSPRAAASVLLGALWRQ